MAILQMGQNKWVTLEKFSVLVASTPTYLKLMTIHLIVLVRHSTEMKKKKRTICKVI